MNWKQNIKWFSHLQENRKSLVSTGRLQIQFPDEVLQVCPTINICVHKYIYGYICIYTYIYVYVCTYIYTYMYLYIYIYIYECLCRGGCVDFCVFVCWNVPTFIIRRLFSALHSSMIWFPKSGNMIHAVLKLFKISDTDGIVVPRL